MSRVMRQVVLWIPLFEVAATASCHMIPGSRHVIPHTINIHGRGDHVPVT